MFDIISPSPSHTPFSSVFLLLSSSAFRTHIGCLRPLSHMGKEGKNGGGIRTQRSRKKREVTHTKTCIQRLRGSLRWRAPPRYTGESGTHRHRWWSPCRDGPLLNPRCISNINPLEKVCVRDGGVPFSSQQILWIKLHCSRVLQSLSILRSLAGHFAVMHK